MPGDRLCPLYSQSRGPGDAPSLHPLHLLHPWGCSGLCSPGLCGAGGSGDGGGAEEEEEERKEGKVQCEAVLDVSGTRLRSPSGVAPGQDAQPFPSTHEGGPMPLSPRRGLQGPLPSCRTAPT